MTYEIRASESAIQHLVEEAVKTERERCAKIADARIKTWCVERPLHSFCVYSCDDIRDIAAEIRGGQ